MPPTAFDAFVQNFEKETNVLLISSLLIPKIFVQDKSAVTNPDKLSLPDRLLHNQGTAPAGNQRYEILSDKGIALLEAYFSVVSLTGVLTDGS
jgi:hypothetical protein